MSDGRGETDPDWTEATLRPWKPSVAGRFNALWRGAVLAVLCFGGLLLLLLVRLLERPLHGPHRPWTPHITRAVCRAALRVMGIGLTVRGTPMTQPGAQVANHSGWMDIFVLNACECLYFVSKAEVAGWPGIGWLARATGTVFITRKGTEAKLQEELFDSRLRAGHRLMFFPEGTSTDSRRILPFKSTLFAAFFRPGLADVVHVQPVTVIYRAPPGQDLRFFGWWGEMAFGPHLYRVLAEGQGGRAEVVFHPPVAVRAIGDRKSLAAHCERAVRAAHDVALADGPRLAG